MTIKNAVAIACVAAMPLFAQTTADTTGTISKETTKETTKTAKKVVKKSAKSKASRARVWNDATRLAAILSDAQNPKWNISEGAWRVFANEANMLANRIYANTGGRTQAQQLRTHVRQMREAALKGDVAGTRQHAGEALPFAYQLIDWSASK